MDDKLRFINDGSLNYNYWLKLFKTTSFYLLITKNSVEVPKVFELMNKNI